MKIRANKSNLRSFAGNAVTLTVVLFSALSTFATENTRQPTSRDVSITPGAKNWESAKCSGSRGPQFKTEIFRELIGVDTFSVSLRRRGRLENNETLILTGRGIGLNCQDLEIEDRPLYVWLMKPLQQGLIYARLSRGQHQWDVNFTSSGEFEIRIQASEFFTAEELEKIRRGQSLDNVRFKLNFGATKSIKSFFSGTKSLKFERQHVAKVSPNEDGAAVFETQ